jgi:beta-glucosidase
VTGYYAWSLLDNFGMGRRLQAALRSGLGLVYVDYQNQKRVPKDSFDWYRKLIASNGKSLTEKTAVPAAKVTPLSRGLLSGW